MEDDTRAVTSRAIQQTAENRKTRRQQRTLEYRPRLACKLLYFLCVATSTENLALLQTVIDGPVDVSHHKVPCVKCLCNAVMCMFIGMGGRGDAIRNATANNVKDATSGLQATLPLRYLH